VVPNSLHNASSVPADHLDRCVLDDHGDALTAPFDDTNDRSADPPGEDQFEIYPLSVSSIHSCDYQEYISRAHLIPELVLKIIPTNRIMLWNAQIAPPKIRGIVEKTNDSPIVVAVVPSVTDEDLVCSKVGHGSLQCPRLNVPTIWLGRITFRMTGPKQRRDAPL